MSLAALLAATALTPQLRLPVLTQAAPLQDPPAMPLMVAQPDRLALTPILDGTLQPMEWDPLMTVGGKPWAMQWEPGKLFVGGELGAEEELVVSLDLAANGWLVGKDNLEIRVAFEGEVARVRARFLDATNPNGPVWVPAPEYEMAAFVASQLAGAARNLELAIVDPAAGALPDREGQRFGARLDVQPKDALEVQAFLPRQTVALRAVFERGSNVPGGLRWRPQQENRLVGPGSSLFVRMTFNGTNELGLTRLELATFAQDSSKFGSRGTPFPRFDNKGRAFVDYETPIPSEVAPGYRVLQGTLRDAQGQTAFLEASFRVAALVETDLVLPDRLRVSESERRVRVPLRIVTLSPKVMRGTYNLRLPEGWRVEEGGQRDFRLAGAGAMARRVPQVIIPANARGVFSIRVNAEVDGKDYGRTYWLRID